MFRRVLLSSVLMILGQISFAATPISFPGAMGFGNGATGGRGGTVYHVTTLADAGTGSFRDAVSASNRIVVFDVGGYITLKTAVSISSNITIAGQTAPGGGIGFRGGELSCAKKSNIIIRYVRIRPGSETASTGDDALSLYLAHNVILDHCSFEFAPWNNIDGVSDDYVNNPVTNISFQYSLIADPIGQQFGAHCESVNSNWSWYYNAFVNSHNRNPLAKVNDVFVNNVEYNNEASYTTHTSTNFNHDIVNNYFIYGPSTSGNTWYQVDKNQSIYYSGNMLDDDGDGVLNGSTTTPYWYQGPGTILTSPWSTVTSSNPIYSAASAFRIVTSLTGTRPYDQLDSLIWSQVNSMGKSGPSSLYTSQAQTGLTSNGYGTIASGTKPTDTDNDGMPDFWEAAMGSNVSMNDAMTIGSDGYALVEAYINWLGANHARTLGAAYVDINLLAFTQGFKSVAPTFTTANGLKGTLSILADGHTARFTPTASYKGLGSFDFTVKGSDGTTFTTTVSVLVEASTGTSSTVASSSIASSSSAVVSSSSVATSSSSASTDPQIVKHGPGASTQIIQVDSAIAVFYFSWLNATGITVAGVPAGINAVIDNAAQTVSFSGAPTVVPGDYVYTLTTVGGTSVVTRSGTFSVIDSLNSSSSTATSSGATSSAGSSSVTTGSSSATVSLLTSQQPLLETQSIRIYDMLGHLVAEQPAGSTMPALAPGLYILRARGSGYAVTYRMR